MPTPTVRAATQADLPDLLRLARAFYAEDGFTTPDAQLQHNLGVLLGAPNAHLAVAEVDGGCHGFALTTTAFILESGLVAELQDLYVTPPARRRGIGIALIDDAADWATGEAASQLEVVIAPNGHDVSHLHEFYRARGFVDEGRRIVVRELPVR